jgi:hypothetical protein
VPYGAHYLEQYKMKAIIIAILNLFRDPMPDEGHAVYDAIGE